MRRGLILFAVSWIFLPSIYSHLPPVRPHVEPLPEVPTKVYVWRHFHQPGYTRNERMIYEAVHADE